LNPELLVERLFHVLVTGNRSGAAAIVAEMTDDGATPEWIAHEVYWPVIEMISQLFRSDQLTTLAHHYAIRLLRRLIDHTQLDYEPRGPRGRSVLIFSGPSESDELAGQLAADLLESDGYETRFAGGGVANDEILGEIGEHHPDVLLMFSSGATDAPNIRLIIDTVREINAAPQMQIVVGGGVFNRADGLAEEIGADLWARTPSELLTRLHQEPARRATPEQRTVGRTRKVTGEAA